MREANTSSRLVELVELVEEVEGREAAPCYFSWLFSPSGITAFLSLYFFFFFCIIRSFTASTSDPQWKLSGRLVGRARAAERVTAGFCVFALLLRSE